MRVPQPKEMLLRLLGVLPRRMLLKLEAWRYSRLLRPLSDRLAAWLREGTTTVRHGAAAGLRFRAGAGKLGYAAGINEPSVQDALVALLKPGGVFFDIGANVGFLTLIGAKLVQPTGRVFAFEPIPWLAETIRKNAALNAFDNIVVLESAVSATEGQGVLWLSEDPTAASLIKDARATSSAEPISVLVVSVDELVLSGSLPAPTVVKIDVEGAEDDVLRGMSGTLRKHSPAIVCELHGTASIVLPRLETAGYTVDVIDRRDEIDDALWLAHVVALPGGR